MTMTPVARAFACVLPALVLSATACGGPEDLGEEGLVAEEESAEPATANEPPQAAPTTKRYYRVQAAGGMGTAIPGQTCTVDDMRVRIWARQPGGTAASWVFLGEVAHSQPVDTTSDTLPLGVGDVKIEYKTTDKPCSAVLSRVHVSAADRPNTFGSRGTIRVSGILRVTPQRSNDITNPAAPGTACGRYEIVGDTQTWRYGTGLIANASATQHVINGFFGPLNLGGCGYLANTGNWKGDTKVGSANPTHVLVGVNLQ